MAATQFAFCAVGSDLDAAPYNGGATFEVKAPTGTSGATTAAANASQTVCRVATDTAVYVAFASSPTASSTAGFMVPANTVAFFRVKSGDKAAVITVKGASMTDYNNYDASTALTSYYTSRAATRPARIWATEKLVQDLAQVGIIDLFEGPGTDPTTLSGYGTDKLWLQVADGVTDAPGTLRIYDGAGTESDIANWPAVTAAMFASYLTSGQVEYKGTWNASTNTPTLASGTGTKGWYYVVSVAGSTNLDGTSTWASGDWAVYNGTAWQKVDNTNQNVSALTEDTANNDETDFLLEYDTSALTHKKLKSKNIGFTPSGTGAVLRTLQSKLRDFVSVKDFGAVGDGTTDDTAALQAALSASVDHIWIPPGTYKITDTLLVTRYGQEIWGPQQAVISMAASVVATVRPAIVVRTTASKAVLRGFSVNHNGDDWATGVGFSTLIGSLAGDARGNAVLIMADNVYAEGVSVYNGWDNGIGVGEFDFATGAQTAGPDAVCVEACETYNCGIGKHDWGPAPSGYYHQGAGVDVLTGTNAVISSCTDYGSYDGFWADITGGGSATFVNCTSVNCAANTIWSDAATGSNQPWNTNGFGATLTGTGAGWLKTPGGVAFYSGTYGVQFIGCVAQNPGMTGFVFDYEASENQAVACRVVGSAMHAYVVAGTDCRLIAPVAEGCGTASGDTAASGSVCPDIGAILVTGCVDRAATVTITIASPGVVTQTGHPYVNGDRIKLSTTGALPTGLTAGTVYYIVNASTNTYQLATTKGGAAITTSGSQSGTHTAKFWRPTECYISDPTVTGSQAYDTDASVIEHAYAIHVRARDSQVATVSMNGGNLVAGNTGTVLCDSGCTMVHIRNQSGEVQIDSYGTSAILNLDAGGDGSAVQLLQSSGGNVDLVNYASTKRIKIAQTGAGGYVSFETNSTERLRVGDEGLTVPVAADVASASTVNLDTATGDPIGITGTTTITAVTLGAGRRRWVRFAASLTLTNGASLVLPTAANITTAAGDTALLQGYTGGVVRCLAYIRSDGKPLAGLGIRTVTGTANQITVTNGDGSSGNPTLSLATTTLPNAGAISGYRNRLINGCMRVNQRESTSVADDTYCFDRWYALTQTGTITIGAQTNIENGWPYAIRLTQAQSSAQRMGLAQIIETANSIDLRGQSVILSARVQMSASTTLRYAILEWTGTADTVTSDWVNDWTSGTYTTGNFFTSTSTVVTAVGSTALTANTPTTITLSGTVGSTANNVAVVFWTESTQAQNVTLDLGKVQLEIGSVATGFVYIPIETVISNCKRYFQTHGEKIYNYIALGWCNSSTSWAATIFLPVQMRVAPSFSNTTATQFVMKGSGVFIGVTAISLDVASSFSVGMTGTVASGLTAGAGVYLQANNAACRIYLDAEL